MYKLNTVNFANAFGFMLRFAERLKKFNVISDVVDTAPKQVVRVVYPCGVKVDVGNKLTTTQVKEQPTVKWRCDQKLFSTTYAECTKSALLSKVAPLVKNSGLKVTVVGTGQVGMACAFSILTQRVSGDLVLIDTMEDKLKGEKLDLQHGSLFIKDAKITASTDYSKSAGSKLCIICAGVRQKKGETRLDLVQRNTEIIKLIVPQLVKYSPKTILMLVSNPVDILTYVAWKISGLPKNRVIGSGTCLDSSRFRFLMSQRLGVAPSSCHGWIIGEHGESAVAVWSGVNVAGVRLSEINPKIGMENDEEKWDLVHKEVVKSGVKVRTLKGYTSSAIALSVTAIAESILRNMGNIQAVSLHAKGYHGIKQDVFLSLPAVLGEDGLNKIVLQQLNSSEKKLLQKSAEILYNVQKGLKF